MGSPAPAAAVSEPTSTLAFSMPATLWQIDPEEDYVHVASYSEPAAAAPLETKAAESETPTLATNTAGIPVHEPAEIAPDAEKSSAPQSAIEDYHSSQVEETEKALLIAQAQENNSEVQPIKASDEPPVVTDSDAKDILVAPEEEDLSASTATLKPSENETLEKAPVKEPVE